MQTTSETNQLYTAPQADPRMLDLRVWMLRNGVTYPQMGQALGGITGNAVQQLLKGERISTARHQDFLRLGVPAHLLPAPRDIRRGRPRKR